MRRTGNLFSKILSWENFLAAAHQAARGKRDRPATRLFFADLAQNLAELMREVDSGDLRVGEFTRFIVRDPKRREVYAPSFRERVLHHALMNQCEAVFERRLIFDTYACRRGKGQQAAVKRAVSFARTYPFFLKMDVRRFFGSVDHVILRSQLACAFSEAALAAIFGLIIDSYQTASGKGLPIGALTSQHFANSYLNPLDRYLKSVRRVRGYVRYMDDFVVWGTSGGELAALRRDLQGFLGQTLALRLKDGPLINRTSHGMDFLGYRVFPGGLQLSRRSKKRYARKLRAAAIAHAAGRWSEATLQRRLQALTSFTCFAGSWHFRRRVLQHLPGEV